MTKEDILKLQSDSSKTRYCKGCDSNLLHSEFYVKKTKGNENSYRFNSPCKSCHNIDSVGRRTYQREYHMMRKYGIDSNNYNDLLKKQLNSCAICGKHQSDQNKNMAVDHCHKSGKIRGLLCDSCNQGLGMFKDSIKFLKNAIKYLDES